MIRKFEIRSAALGLALTLVGSGVVMAQNATNPDGRQAAPAAKVETRLATMRVASRETAPPPANAMLDRDGRVVPMPAARMNSEETAKPCREGERLRPAEISQIAVTEAKAIGLPNEILKAVLRAEYLAAPRPKSPDLETHSDRLSGGLAGSECSVASASIRKAVAELARLRQLYPTPVHYLAAFRDGEEAFLASGGVADRAETLRFIITVLNEMAGSPSELGAINRPVAQVHAPATQSSASRREPLPRAAPPSSPDPRWASGFVLNLE